MTYQVKEITVETGRSLEFGRYQARVSVTLALPPGAQKEDFQMLAIEYWKEAQDLVRHEIKRQQDLDKPATIEEVLDRVDEIDF